MFIISIITGTPFWVWFILAGLIYLGIGRAQDRVVSVKRLVLFPLILAALSLSNLSAMAGSPASLTGFALGLAAGTIIGLWLERRGGAELLPDGKLLVKGDWSSLILVLCIFAARYVSAVVGATNPALAADPAFHTVMAALSGGFAALTLSRTFLRLRVAFA